MRPHSSPHFLMLAGRLSVGTGIGRGQAFLRGRECVGEEAGSLVGMWPLGPDGPPAVNLGADPQS